MYIIGFTNKYYTLWYYERAPIYARGQLVEYYDKYCYIKNISFDLTKVKTLYPNTAIDLALRGSGSFEVRVKVELPYDVVQYGELRGIKISELEDIRVLFGIYKSYNKSNTNIRSSVIARRRLIELGELRRYKISTNLTDKYYDDREYSISCVTNINYATEAQIEYDMRQKRALLINHLHNDGERLTLNLKRIRSNHYESMYGTVFIETFESEEGNEYVYKGTTPPDTELFQWYKMTFTIKHSVYKDKKQTLIQRVKINERVRETIEEC